MLDYIIPQMGEVILLQILRTLDVLQLTSALEFRALSPVFVCADAGLYQAATDVGLVILNPEATP